VHNVHITGMSVENFGDAGIFIFGGSGTRVDNTRLLNNGGYGVFALQSTGTRITENVASGNHEAGIYVGESPNANATVAENDSHGNGFGVFFRDARGGRITDNSLKDNCAGVIVLNTGFLPGAGNVTLSDNTINHNNASCLPGDGPPTSGIGVAILGGDHVTLRDNTIDHNNKSGDTVASGGVILLPGGDANSTPSNHVTVEDNHIRHNDTDIIVAVPLATNVFEDNECGTSSPGGLC
jgi:parallel beta-helix repeat protein